MNERPPRSPACPVDLTRSGAAILLALWSVAVLAFAAMAAVALVQGGVETEGVLSRRFEARQLALTGIALGMNPTIERGDPLYFQSGPAGELEVRVISENARLNLNRLLVERDQRTLRRLFQDWEVPDAEIRIAVDSMVDWTDEDSLRALHGAEREDLLGQSRYSLPENREFVSVDEAARVRGMDAVAAVNPAWADAFSVLAGDRLCVLDADPSLLVAALGISRADADRWVRLRAGPDRIPNTPDDLILENPAQLREILGLDEARAAALERRAEVAGEPTRIESRARIGDVEYVIRVIVDRSENAQGNESVLSWEES